VAETEKRRVGRPLKFSDPVELQKKIDAYFKECDPHFIRNKTEWVQARDSSGSLKKDHHGLNYYVKVTHDVMTEQVHYAITGLALYLDCDRSTLIDYEHGTYFPDDMPQEIKDELSHTIKRAKTRIQAYVERELHSTTPTGAIFNLKANYAWRDNTEDDSLPPPNPIIFMNQVPTKPFKEED
jgi:hypothetical protein